MALLDESANGVFIIAATPFSDNGALDLESVDRMVDFYLERGANGLTILGVMGEAPKLTEEESRAFISRAIARARGAPIIVGVSAPGLASIRTLAASAMDAGAAGVMVAPPGHLRTDDQIYSYFDSVAETLGATPFALQDYPQATGGCRCRRQPHPPHRGNHHQLRHAQARGLAGVGQDLYLALLRASPPLRRISILAGNNGLFLPEELLRGGADGAMTGFSFPERMAADVIAAHEAGDPARAAELQLIHPPDLAKDRYEHQPGIGLAVRKYVLAKHGAMAFVHPAHARRDAFSNRHRRSGEPHRAPDAGRAAGDRVTARAVVSAASDGLDNPDLDAAFRQNRLRSLERAAPDGIVEIGRGRVQAGDAGVDDGAGAIDAREEGRGEMRAGRRHAPSGRFEDRVALGMLHPDESSVALMALLEVAHASRERCCRLRSPFRRGRQG